MPLYEYECDACGERFERIQKFSDPPVEVCPHCGKKTVRKLLSSPAIQFKGTGWYITDYARKGAKDGDGGKPASADGKETKGGEKGREKAAEKAAEKPAEKAEKQSTVDSQQSKQQSAIDSGQSKKQSTVGSRKQTDD